MRNPEYELTAQWGAATRIVAEATRMVARLKSSGFVRLVGELRDAFAHLPSQILSLGARPTAVPVRVVSWRAPERRAGARSRARSARD
jgi:hypothetical protein